MFVDVNLCDVRNVSPGDLSSTSSDTSSESIITPAYSSFSSDSASSPLTCSFSPLESGPETEEEYSTEEEGIVLLLYALTEKH